MKKFKFLTFEKICSNYCLDVLLNLYKFVNGELSSYLSDEAKNNLNLFFFNPILFLQLGFSQKMSNNMTLISNYLNECGLVKSPNKTSAAAAATNTAATDGAARGMTGRISSYAPLDKILKNVDAEISKFQNCQSEMHEHLVNQYKNEKKAVETSSSSCVGDQRDLDEEEDEEEEEEGAEEKKLCGDDPSATIDLESPKEEEQQQQGSFVEGKRKRPKNRKIGDGITIWKDVIRCFINLLTNTFEKLTNLPIFSCDIKENKNLIHNPIFNLLFQNRPNVTIFDESVVLFNVVTVFNCYFLMLYFYDIPNLFTGRYDLFKFRNMIDPSVYRNLSNIEKENLTKCLKNLQIFKSGGNRCHHISCNFIKRFLPTDFKKFKAISPLYDAVCSENCFRNLTRNIPVDESSGGDGGVGSRGRCRHEFSMIKAVMFYVDHFEEIVLQHENWMFENFVRTTVSATPRSPSSSPSPFFEEPLTKKMKIDDSPDPWNIYDDEDNEEEEEMEEDDNDSRIHFVS